MALRGHFSLDPEDPTSFDEEPASFVPDAAAFSLDPPEADAELPSVVASTDKVFLAAPFMARMRTSTSVSVAHVPQQTS
eukprot:m51a1_g9482 hypothetical protein (79) ;mRNA; f:610187-610423